MQKRPGPKSSYASLAKRPHLKSGTETHPSGKKSAGGSVSATSADTMKKGGHGDSELLMFHSPQPHSSSASAVFQVGMLFHF